MKSCLECINRIKGKEETDGFTRMYCVIYGKFKEPVQDDEEFCKMYCSKQG